MKYAINYTRFGKFRYLDEVDEIIVTYRSSDKTLLDFLKAHSNQRVILSIEDEKDFIESDSLALLTAIHTEYPDLNFSARFSSHRSELVQEIEAAISKQEPEDRIPFFYNTHINDFDTLWGYLKLHPTDVYITDALGFSIVQAAGAAHWQGVNVRIFPNVAQSVCPSTASILKFFVRPEDTELYENYVDVMEFYGDSEKLSTYYKIYAIDKKWFGDLKEIIIDFKQNLDSRCLLSDFGKHRLKCGKKCLQGSKCSICLAAENAARTLSSQNLILKDLEHPRKLGKSD